MAQHSMVVSDVTCDIVHYIFKVAFEYEFGALSFVRIFFLFFLSATYLRYSQLWATAYEITAFTWR